MTTNLQQRIAAIKTECEELLRLEPTIAGPDKWKADRDDTGKPCVMYGEYYVAEMTMLAPGNGKDCTMSENARFIAAARNASPAMARVVLWMIKNCEAWLTDELNHDEAAKILADLANQWESRP